MTLTLRPGMMTWRNEPGPTIEPLRRIAKGDSANVSLVSFGDHTRTILAGLRKEREDPA